MVQKQTSVTHLSECCLHNESKGKSLKKMEKKFIHASLNGLC